MEKSQPEKTVRNAAFTKILGGIYRRFGGSIILGLIAISGFLIFFGWLAEEVFEGDTKSFDERVRNYVHEFASPPVTAVMKFFTYLGSPLYLTILGVIVIIVLFYLKRKRAVALFLIAMAGEVVLNFALKSFFARARPEPFFDFSLPSSYSFPSGHAFGSLCFFGILAWLAAARAQSKTIKIAIAAAASAVIFLIGFSRIYLGVHYPSDVLAGYAAGIFWIGVIALTDARLRRKNAT